MPSLVLPWVSDKHASTRTHARTYTHARARSPDDTEAAKGGRQLPLVGREAMLRICVCAEMSWLPPQFFFSIFLKLKTIAGMYF